jgi:hypothetical protein
MLALIGVAPTFLSLEGLRRSASPKELCSRFQTIKAIAWQHSSFGGLAANARLIVVNADESSQGPVEI